MEIDCTKFKCTKSVIPPIHVMPYHVSFMKHQYDSGNDIYLTPKCDGVYSQFKLNNNDNNVFQCELIDNFAYVFDIICLTISSFRTKMRLLELIFNVKILYTIKNVNDIHTIFNKYHLEFKLTQSKNSSKIIRTKPVFVINKNTFDSDEIKKLFNIFDNEYYTPDYPNDGWILYIDQLNNPLKIKSLKYLTVDLSYDGMTNCKTSDGNIIFVHNIPKKLLNCIIRCNWNNNHWEYLDTRKDKNSANNMNIVKNIYENIKNPIQYYDIWTQHYQMPYYNGNCNANNNNIKSLRLASFELIYKILCCVSKIQTSVSIIDIGCGNGSLNKYLLSKHIDQYSYIGVDIDPFILSKSSPNGVHIWNDFNSPTFFSRINNCFFDFAVFINSFHYISDKKQFLINMKEHFHNIIIVDLFDNNNFDNIETGDVIIKRKYDNLFEFNYKWKNNIFIEKIMKKSDFEKYIFDANGWNIHSCKKFESHTSDKFINLHTMYVITSNNYQMPIDNNPIFVL